MKGISDTAVGASYVKSARGGKIRSAPKSKHSSYLDLFSLAIERNRLTQEQANLGKRRSQIEVRMERNQTRLDEIRCQLQAMGECIRDEESKRPAASQPNVKLPSKRWRTVSANY